MNQPQDVTILICVSRTCQASNKLLRVMTDFHEHEGHELKQLKTIQNILQSKENILSNILNASDMNALFHEIDIKVKQIQTEFENKLKDQANSLKIQISEQSRDLELYGRNLQIVMKNNIEMLKTIQDSIPDLIETSEEELIQKITQQFERQQQMISKKLQPFYNILERLPQEPNSLYQSIILNRTKVQGISEYSKRALNISKSTDYLLLEWFEQKEINLKLIYRGSRDGFSAHKFHQMCDNQGPTLTFVRSNYHKVFGGFTSQSWISPKQKAFSSDDKAFIFSLTEMTKHPIKHTDSAIMHKNNYLVQFGGIDGKKRDFAIVDKCNETETNFSDFPSSYSSSEQLDQDRDLQDFYLAGHDCFKVMEIEVYKVLSTQ